MENISKRSVYILESAIDKPQILNRQEIPDNGMQAVQNLAAVYVSMTNGQNRPVELPIDTTLVL